MIDSTATAASAAKKALRDAGGAVHASALSGDYCSRRSWIVPERQVKSISSGGSDARRQGFGERPIIKRISSSLTMAPNCADKVKKG